MQCLETTRKTAKRIRADLIYSCRTHAVWWVKSYVRQRESKQLLKDNSHLVFKLVSFKSKLKTMRLINLRCSEVRIDRKCTESRWIKKKVQFQWHQFFSIIKCNRYIIIYSNKKLLSWTFEGVVFIQLDQKLVLDFQIVVLTLLTCEHKSIQSI